MLNVEQNIILSNLFVFLSVVSLSVSDGLDVSVPVPDPVPSSAGFGQTLAFKYSTISSLVYPAANNYI